MQELCSVPEKDNHLNKALLKEKLMLLKKLNDECQEYLNNLREENNKKEKYIEAVKAGQDV